MEELHWPVDISQQKEQFSNAYLEALAAAAGYALAKPGVDEDSIDWTLSGRGGSVYRSFKLDVQLKCTSTQIQASNGLHFPLSRKNYDDLRAINVTAPRILIVVLVPEDTAQWVDQTAESLLMHGRGYWVSLRGEPESGNLATVTVLLPESQVTTRESLVGIMKRVGGGLLP